MKSCLLSQFLFDIVLWSHSYNNKAKWENNWTQVKKEKFLKIIKYSYSQIIWFYTKETLKSPSKTLKS